MKNHQIAFYNGNIKIYYPPPHEPLIWKCEKANADVNKRAIWDFDRENKLSFIKINNQVALFDETVVYIMSNLIPNEIIVFDDREPPWLRKMWFIKKLIHHGDNHIKLYLRYFQDLSNTKTEEAKREYFENISHKLLNKYLDPEKYWFLLKIISKDKKIPCIPPFYHNFVSEIKKECGLFNSYLEEQCSLS